MSDPVSVIAFPDDRRLGFNIEFDLGYTWYGSRPSVAADPIKDAIVIRNEDPRGCSVRMPSVQIAFVADGKLDMLGNEINTVSQLNQFRIGRASKTWIDFNDDRATLRPPEFNVRWSPAKVESPQTVQRDIGDTFVFVIIQRGRKGEFTKDEIGWGPNSAAPIAMTSFPIMSAS